MARVDHLDRAILTIDEQTQIPLDEITWQFSRSSGPGGQNVNKTSSRAVLCFDLEHSSLDEAQKARARARLGRLIDSDGMLRIASGSHPSQWQNRQEALARFVALLSFALRPAPSRKRTRVPQAARRERRTAKARQSLKKRQRARPGQEEW